MFLESCGSYCTNFSGAYFHSDLSNNLLAKEYNLGLLLCYLLENEKYICLEYTNLTNITTQILFLFLVFNAVRLHG